MLKLVIHVKSSAEPKVKYPILIPRKISLPTYFNRNIFQLLVYLWLLISLQYIALSYVSYVSLSPLALVKII